MSQDLTLGQKLKIRSMIHVAAEPLPFFWPMRTFIHHNPLHGLEHMPFEEAVTQGSKLFHARGTLSRTEYQRYLKAGKVDTVALEQQVNRFLEQQPTIPGIDLTHWLMQLMTETGRPCCATNRLPDASASGAHIQAALHDRPAPKAVIDKARLAADLHTALLGDRPVYEAVDAIYGSNIGAELDELVIKSCLDFFDEGQSVWGMPEREEGFFTAWRDVALRNVRFFLRGMHISNILAADPTPEGIIAHVLRELEIPEAQWLDYFTRELARLHGWAGFIRWRSSAKHYHWSKQFPGDLVDLVAVRLTLALAVLNERQLHHLAHTRSAIAEKIRRQTYEVYLRHELFTRAALPAMAAEIEMVIASGHAGRINKAFERYIGRKQAHEAKQQAERLTQLAAASDQSDALQALSANELATLIQTISDFEKHEPMCWLQAMESHAIHHLINQINTGEQKRRGKRPFAQALFCIDTRSERIRRQLEGVGDYQTFGIAGFFGIPVSFMALGKGSETHLCPVLLTPKNLITEISTANHHAEAALSALEHAMHELKESVLTPFVTVEAIGLLFGFDMVGKTLAPNNYTRWRKRLHPHKPTTRLLVDKLDREQAESIIRAVQRAVIVGAIQQRFGLEADQMSDSMIREVREHALGRQSGRTQFAKTFALDEKQERDFIQRLRHDYQINPPFAHLQLERLGRIGFTLEEQAHFVSSALKSIGLTQNFSRFVLLVGHGSSSENNPFESALDCGACGGNHGLVNARVLAQMANKIEVRRRLRKQGIDIPTDTHFMPAMHNTTTDEIRVHNIDLMPPPHLVYLDRLLGGLNAAAKRCAQERIPTLEYEKTGKLTTNSAALRAQRNSMDWSQVRPEWGLSGNVYFIIGRRQLTEHLSMDGRAFLHSYNYRVDPKQRLLESILTGPLVVGQWINMEHYFSTVDNERFGSGSKVYHNVACRLGVMTGNLSDLRTGLPSQTVLKNGEPYHEPMRLIAVIEAPLAHAQRALNAVATVKTLVTNTWVRLLVVDPQSTTIHLYENGEWQQQTQANTRYPARSEEPA